MFSCYMHFRIVVGLMYSVRPQRLAMLKKETDDGLRLLQETTLVTNSPSDHI